MNNRPDPDELLKQIKAGEPARGKLKIFLGYAAGVGKTYAMLEAAHQRLKQGVDVVVGYAETHGRVETDAFLSGLEILPRRLVEYHGVKLLEMDVDAILERKPTLVLVDEFAHTNAPGSRHPKRFQDVEEILDAGIDVYTTLNVQHLESLNNVVTQVTGVEVRETIPDRVLDEASEIEVIDLPPDELLSRFKEGKVYIPEQAQRAIQKFFRKGNLSALREMSLRRAAERVDDQMRTYMRTRAIPGPWPAAERLLVCISPSPLAEKLVRTTRRLADELNAEWFAVYVDVVYKPELIPANRERIGKMLHLAEELGARSRTLTGRSIPDSVLAYAKKHNINKIVIGKPVQPRWKELFSGSIVDQLISASGDIDIFVISAQTENNQQVFSSEWQPHQPYSRYLLALGLVAVSTLLGLTVRENLEPTNLIMLFLASTVVAASFLGRGPALLTSLLSVLAFDFFLIPPYLTFAVNDTQYLITFAGFLAVSIVISSLTARSKEQAEFSIQRESQTSALYNLVRDLTSAVDLDQVVKIVLSQVSQVFECEAAIFLPEKGLLATYSSSSNYHPDENDLAVATWAFDHGQPAGTATDTLPAASIRCQPLITSKGHVGVLGIQSKKSEKLFSSEQQQTFTAFAHQAALAIERALFAEQARDAEILQATEKLQSALLNSISHDLRTPLASITGALSSLQEKSLELNQKDRNILLKTAHEEAERLNRLVENLLNMTRLEAGAIHLRLEPNDIQDVIGASLEQMGERLANRKIKINIAPDLPLIPLDFSLFGQVLVNLFDNAVKYSPATSIIEVNAYQVEDSVRIEVSDRGVGIPSQDLERVFEKFYRVHRPESVSGTGLGLTICKGIIEIHGGTIKASNRSGGGTIITVDLPKEKSG